MLGLINIIAKIFRQLNLPILTNFDYRNVTLSYDQITNFFSQFNNIFSKLGFTLNIFFQVFGISIMSFYMMNDKNNFYKKFYWFTKSEKKIKKIKHFFIVLENQLGGWVRGQFILMVIIGVITYVALFFFQLPYALPLAILAGLLEALPGLGPTLSSVPAIIFALFLNNNGEINIVYGISIAVLYFVIQQIENTFLVPKIMSDNAHINPLISIMSILIGFEIAGVFGALLALPFFIICRCIYQIYNNLA